MGESHGEDSSGRGVADSPVEVEGERGEGNWERANAVGETLVEGDGGAREGNRPLEARIFKARSPASLARRALRRPEGDRLASEGLRRRNKREDELEDEVCEATSSARRTRCSNADRSREVGFWLDDPAPPWLCEGSDWDGGGSSAMSCSR